MHTISQRTADGALTRVLLAVLSVGEVVAALAVHGAVKVIVWQERSRERRRLATLDDFMLRDIGISRSDVAHEVNKPFWQG
jgi:uncharacterized protein YjiS (DUF1127 family)